MKTYPGASMRMARLLNGGGRVLLARLRVAEGFWQRARGLIGRPCPGEGEGLWLGDCGSVHTCFMAYAIDVVFLDGAGTVLGISAGLPPWRMAWFRGAVSVLELADGEAARVGLAAGMATKVAEAVEAV